jgi:hypothetical protein
LRLKASLGKRFVKPYLENTQHKKMFGRVAQVVEHLPSKHDTLSSSSSTSKKSIDHLSIYLSIYLSIHLSIYLLCERAGSIASKYKALSSNPSVAKKTQKQNKTKKHE